MGLVKRMLEKQGFFDIPIETRECPNCGGEMQEQQQDYASMTEGQQADYDGGFNRPFECPDCGNYGLFDIEIYEDEEGIDYDSFELQEEVKLSQTSETIEEDTENKTIVGIIMVELINIESEIDSIILRKYFENNPSLREDFSKNLLNKEFFSLEQKIIILSKIVEKNEKELIKNIRIFQAIRNAIAHTRGEFDGKKRNYKITYKINGKTKTIDLNRGFIHEFQNDSFTIKESLKKILCKK